METVWGSEHLVLTIDSGGDPAKEDAAVAELLDRRVDGIIYAPWGEGRGVSRVGGMQGVRVVLIGGTSHTGKSSVARAVAERLGFDCRSTDKLARHPGRPWRTAEWVPPPHVAEHYAGLDVDELIRSVLDHYARLWPRIEELITDRAAKDGPGLVLEGSALWPERVAGLTSVPRTGAVWLTADEAVLRERMRASARYEQATERERYLVDKFLARAERFQTLMGQIVDAYDLPRIDTGGRPVGEVADAVLSAVGMSAR